MITLSEKRFQLRGRINMLTSYPMASTATVKRYRFIYIIVDLQSRRILKFKNELNKKKRVYCRVYSVDFEEIVFF